MNTNPEIYKKPTHLMIGYGTYKNVKWAILNNNGLHPLAYAEKIKDVPDLYDNPAYLGITFDGYCYWNAEDTGCYYGWDYAHCCDYNEKYNPEGDKHNYEEIKQHIYNFIDYMLSL